jgi:hypothetical protein
MAKLTIEDLHNLTRKVEEIEKAGGEAFALTSFTPAMLIPVEAVDFDPWVPAANIFHGIGTLEDLVKKAEKNALHGTDPFCEEVTGGVRRNGEKIYKAPGELWDSTVWMCWDGGSEFIENPVTVWHNFEDDEFDPWGEIHEGSVEQIPVTCEALESFARHALTRHKGSAEVLPAREFLAELAAKLGV